MHVIQHDHGRLPPSDGTEERRPGRHDLRPLGDTPEPGRRCTLGLPALTQMNPQPLPLGRIEGERFDGTIEGRVPVAGSCAFRPAGVDADDRAERL